MFRSRWVPCLVLYAEINKESLPQKPSLWSVPRRNPFFTGREDILKHLYRTLTSTVEGQATRPVALTGLGGVGKTQTIIEYIWRHRSDYRVVCWIKAGNSDTIASEFVRIAQSINLLEAPSPDAKKAITTFKDWMNGHSQWLLVLDKVETPEILQEFLPDEPRGHILITSQAQAMGIIAQKLI